MDAVDALLAQSDQSDAVDKLLAHFPDEKPFGLMDTWPVRLGKTLYNSAADAATLPGDVYSGKQSISDPSITGRALNFAGVASPGVTAPLNWAASVAKAPTEKALMQEGAMMRNVINNSPVALSGPMVGKWSQAVQSLLRRKGLFDTGNSAPTTHAILKELDTTSGNGAHLTAADYVNLRRAFQEQAQNFKSGPDQAAASISIKALDNLFQKAPSSAFVAGTPAEISAARKLVNDANSNFAAAYKSRAVTGKEQSAELQSLSANSGKNYDNSVRRKIAGGILQREIEYPGSTGYSPEELASMEKLVGGTVVRNTARQLGNKMGGGGGLGASVWTIPSGFAAFASGDWKPLALGVGVPTAGAAIKGVENLLTKREVGKLANQIRQRSELAQRPAAPRAPLAPLSPAAQQAYRLLGMAPLIGGNTLDEYIAQNPNQL